MLAIVVILLLIPFIGMQFTKEIAWTGLDFLVMGILLLSTGLLAEFTFRRVTNKKRKTTLLITIILMFLMVWAELAVGIFGTPFAGS